MSKFADATAIRPVDSHTYAAHFPDEWCIGSVPNGGFVTSCILRCASTHFETTLPAQDQPHPISVHVEFVRRTQAGDATFVVKEIKLGRQTSTIHITLIQEDREEVLAYVTMSNLAKENGASHSTGWSLHPPPYPVNLDDLKEDRDENWVWISSMPFPNFRKATKKLHFFLPKKGAFMKSMTDEWVRFSTGERLTNDSLGFVADMFPMMLENYAHGPDPFKVPTLEQQLNKAKVGKFWYPTLSLNLDIKKALPDEGVEFLFVRVSTKIVKNGRFDLEVIILDQLGEVVAISHHVTMVLSAERNMAQRSKAPLEGKL